MTEVASPADGRIATGKNGSVRPSSTITGTTEQKRKGEKGSGDGSVSELLHQLNSLYRSSLESGFLGGSSTVTNLIIGQGLLSSHSSVVASAYGLLSLIAEELDEMDWASVKVAFTRDLMGEETPLKLKALRSLSLLPAKLHVGELSWFLEHVSLALGDASGVVRAAACDGLRTLLPFSQPRRRADAIPIVEVLSQVINCVTDADHSCVSSAWKAIRVALDRGQEQSCLKAPSDAVDLGFVTLQCCREAFENPTRIAVVVRHVEALPMRLRWPAIRPLCDILPFLSEKSMVLSFLEVHLETHELSLVYETARGIIRGNRLHKDLFEMALVRRAAFSLLRCASLPASCGGTPTLVAEAAECLSLVPSRNVATHAPALLVSAGILAAAAPLRAGRVSGVNVRNVCSYRALVSVWGTVLQAAREEIEVNPDAHLSRANVPSSLSQLPHSRVSSGDVLLGHVPGRSLEVHALRRVLGDPRIQSFFAQDSRVSRAVVLCLVEAAAGMLRASRERFGSEEEVVKRDGALLLLVVDVIEVSWGTILHPECAFQAERVLILCSDVQLYTSRSSLMNVEWLMALHDRLVNVVLMVVDLISSIRVVSVACRFLLLACSMCPLREEQSDNVEGRTNGVSVDQLVEVLGSLSESAPRVLAQCLRVLRARIPNMRSARLTSLKDVGAEEARFDEGFRVMSSGPHGRSLRSVVCDNDAGSSVVAFVDDWSFDEEVLGQRCLLSTATERSSPVPCSHVPRSLDARAEELSSSSDPLCVRAICVPAEHIHSVTSSDVLCRHDLYSPLSEHMRWFVYVSVHNSTSSTAERLMVRIGVSGAEGGGSSFLGSLSGGRRVVVPPCPACEFLVSGIWFVRLHIEVSFESSAQDSSGVSADGSQAYFAKTTQFTVRCRSLVVPPLAFLVPPRRGGLCAEWPVLWDVLPSSCVFRPCRMEEHAHGAPPAPSLNSVDLCFHPHQGHFSPFSVVSCMRSTAFIGLRLICRTFWGAFVLCAVSAHRSEDLWLAEIEVRGPRREVQALADAEEFFVTHLIVFFDKEEVVIGTPPDPAAGLKAHLHFATCHKPLPNSSE